MSSDSAILRGMIQAIALDFGNVISEPHDTGCYARMAALAGLEAGYFMEAFWRYRPAFDRGSIRGRRMYREVLADAGVAGSEAELDSLADALLDEDLASWFRISRPVTEWALSLKQAGFKLGILSNMPFDFMERYGDEIELFRKADAPVFSCYLGQIKPEPAIYRSLVEGLGCQPEEIVFFDDLEANVRGGLEAGLRARLWAGLERAKEDWEREVRASGTAAASQ